MSDYIERGLRRARGPNLPTVGAVCRDDEGRFARFSVRMDGGRVAEVSFRATPCATLIAYCEVAAERIAGRAPTAAAGGLRPSDIADALPQVPEHKRDRARLAALALIATIGRVSEETAA